jgi:hypothetical protein
MKLSCFHLQQVVAASLAVWSIDAALLGLAQSDKPAGRSTLERMELKRLMAVAAARQRFAAERVLVPARRGLRDFRGVFHVHAEDSPHTGGTRDEVLEACRRTGVHVVFLTDHKQRGSFKSNWRGLHHGVLFITGSETEGFLSFPEEPISHPAVEGNQYITQVLRDGGLIFLSHLEERLDDSPAGLTGYEVYNAHAEVKNQVATALMLLGSLCDVKQWPLLLHKVMSYGDEWMGALQHYPHLYLQKWDRDCERQPLTGIAANDAHHNQTFSVVVRDDRSASIRTVGNPDFLALDTKRQPELAPLLRGRKKDDVLFRLDLDPYERSFRNTNTHVMASELSEPTIRDALRCGRAYVAHEWLAEATGFEFIADAGDIVYEMGDSVELQPGLRLVTRAPLPGWFRLIRNGKPLAKAKGASYLFPVQAPGIYRVEVWLEVDGEERPWIYSNPIWVGMRPPGRSWTFRKCGQKRAMTSFTQGL